MCIRDRFFGRKGKLFELDWILIVGPGEGDHGHKTCSGYSDSSQHAAPDITLVLKDTEAAIHDRRTGDVVAKKTFPPDPACPSLTLVHGDETTSDSTPPYDDIIAWARARVKR